MTKSETVDTLSENKVIYYSFGKFLSPESLMIMTQKHLEICCSGVMSSQGKVRTYQVGAVFVTIMRCSEISNLAFHFIVLTFGPPCWSNPSTSHKSS